MNRPVVVYAAMVMVVWQNIKNEDGKMGNADMGWSDVTLRISYWIRNRSLVCSSFRYLSL